MLSRGASLLRGSQASLRRAGQLYPTTARSWASALATTGVRGHHNGLEPLDTFPRRHIGPREADAEEMLSTLGYKSFDEMTDAIIPKQIRLGRELELSTQQSPNDPQVGEAETIAAFREQFASDTASKMTHMIGLGYYDTLTPTVILRNIVENPQWYTPYTPYQAEMSQGRLQSLINFQTMCTDLTGHEFGNASLLDEGTAAAEAMAMCFNIGKAKRKRFLVSDQVFPQTIDVVQTRATPFGIEVEVVPEAALAGGEIDFSGKDVCGVLVQYPRGDGVVSDYSHLTKSAHDNKTLVIAATDLLALTKIKEPGAWGADIAVGSAQRFGVPLGYGGPHAAFMTTSSKYKRSMAGRVIGVSRDAQGSRAYRMSLQAREQHIRREKATSNICTAQALLANVAAMYAVYHGPQGLTAIGNRTASLAQTFRSAMGADDAANPVFDTVTLTVPDASAAVVAAENAGINIRRVSDTQISVAFDETSQLSHVEALVSALGGDASKVHAAIPDAVSFGAHERSSDFLTHPIFNMYHSETEMLRYINRLAGKDLGLHTSMIPLGSCTMKLNATSEMIPITWPEINRVHPFVPPAQTPGYRKFIDDLAEDLAEITGFAKVSLQPNAGSQGEYLGLRCISAYHESRGEGHRDVCLIPISAHGTNPASAAMAGMRVVIVASDERGNVDLEDLRAKAEEHKDNLAALMVTYPSTYGVFEAAITDVIDCVHDNGGQVYLDGANMNAQVGLCRPGDYGADVLHLNLHKTFCIPHGGGGPGMGPIGVASHLAPFLPGHSLIEGVGGESALGAVSAAPWGSASILPITGMYIRMMGAKGLRQASEHAILAANYMAERLRGHYEIAYCDDNGRTAHEFILNCREFKDAAGIEVSDIAKRLMDYGFHAPTMSWPVHDSLMLEPTESESKEELDRYIDALLSIRAEIQDVIDGKVDSHDNVLKHAPHTQAVITADEWTRPYTRAQAAFPKPYLREFKFWPTVARIDDVYGDKNVVCTCPPIETYME